MTFINAGPGEYTAQRPARFADDLSALLDDATFDGTVTVSGSDVPATYDAPRIVCTGQVAAGDSVTVTYDVVITGVGDRETVNVAYVAPAPAICPADALAARPPPTPTPPNPEDCVADNGIDAATGQPCAVVDEPLPKLALTKSSPAGARADRRHRDIHGDGHERGQAGRRCRRPAEVIDDLTGVLDDAAFDGAVLAAYPGHSAPPNGSGLAKGVQAA